MKHLFLVGFMGVGKTTIGKQISKKIKLPFIDTDNAVENLTGKSIAEIFSNDGEAQFRFFENQVIQELNGVTSLVVSTGGGLPCFYNNMDLLLQTGYVVYLNAQPAFITSRLLASKKPRPLIQNLSQTDLLAWVGHTIKQREEVYLRSNLIVDATAKSVGDIVKSILIGYQAKLKKGY